MPTIITHILQHSFAILFSKALIQTYTPLTHQLKLRDYAVSISSASLSLSPAVALTRKCINTSSWRV